MTLCPSQKGLASVLLVAAITGALAAEPTPRRFPDRSPLGTLDLATCAAAAKGAGEDAPLWFKALMERYRWHYPEDTAEGLRLRTEGVVQSREGKLFRRGMTSKKAFKAFFDQNCAAHKPIPKGGP
jgi:hypothetical protein